MIILYVAVLYVVFCMMLTRCPVIGSWQQLVSDVDVVTHDNVPWFT